MGTTTWICRSVGAAAVVLGTATVGTGAIASPETAPSGGWTVADVGALALDGGVAAALSPDGDLLAGIGPDATFCLWEVATLQPTCDDTRLPLAAPLRGPTMAWAPDGSAVAFDLDLARLLYDSDVYVYDVAASAVTNLTDDGVEDTWFGAPDGTPGDIVPTWSPNGSELAFVRSERSGNRSSTTLMRMPRTGGEPTVVHEVTSDMPLAVWLPLHWREDGTIVYGHGSPAPDEPANGLWRVGSGGEEPEQIVPGSGDAEIPQAAPFDVHGDLASMYSPTLSAQVYGVDRPVYWVADLASGEATALPGFDPEASASVPLEDVTAEETFRRIAAPMSPAAISPDGSALLVAYLVGDEPFLAVVDPTTWSATRLEHPALDGLEPVRWVQWTDSGTALVSTVGDALVVELSPGERPMTPRAASA